MSQTKIVVIPFKKLLIGAVIAAIIIAFIIFAVIRLGSNSSDNSRNTTKPKSSTVNASASSNIETPLDNADAPKFCPGVYTASILLDGNPVDIQVTVDSSNINSIELVNLSESITTMYPKLTTSFDEVAAKVMEAGTTNITYDSANRYTYSVFIEAISAALKKAAPYTSTLEQAYLVPIADINKSFISTFLKLSEELSHLLRLYI